MPLALLQLLAVATVLPVSSRLASGDLLGALINAIAANLDFLRQLGYIANARTTTSRGAP
jgi:hypothetical protein